MDPLNVSPPADPQARVAHVHQLLQRAQLGWLSKQDVLDVLTNWKEYRFRISMTPPDQPGSGSLFLFDRTQLRSFRRDGHLWKKKPDGKTVQETHEKLKIEGGIQALNCYYAHTADGALQRRCYWKLAGNMSIVLMHYQSSPKRRASVLAELDAPVDSRVGRALAECTQAGPKAVSDTLSEPAPCERAHSDTAELQSKASSTSQSGPTCSQPQEVVRPENREAPDCGTSRAQGSEGAQKMGALCDTGCQAITSPGFLLPSLSGMSAMRGHLQPHAQALYAPSMYSQPCSQARLPAGISPPLDFGSMAAWSPSVGSYASERSLPQSNAAAPFAAASSVAQHTLALDSPDPALAAAGLLGKARPAPSALQNPAVAPFSHDGIGGYSLGRGLGGWSARSHWSAARPPPQLVHGMMHLQSAGQCFMGAVHVPGAAALASSFDSEPRQAASGSMLKRARCDGEEDASGLPSTALCSNPVAESMKLASGASEFDDLPAVKRSRISAQD